MFVLKLKEMRKKAGLKTQKAAAELLGMKERRYMSLERGEVSLTLADAYEIAVAFGCTPNDLCAFPARGQVPPETRDPLRDELVRAYDACDGPRRVRLVETARDAAGMSGEVPERRVHVAEGVA